MSPLFTATNRGLTPPLASPESEDPPLLPLLCQLALVLPAADPAAPSALVLSVKGPVTMEREGDKPARVGPLDVLRPGDRLVTRDGGEAVLLFLGNGHRERLKQNGRAKVEVAGCTPRAAVEKLEAVKLSAANLDRVQQLNRVGQAGLIVTRSPTRTRHPLVAPMFDAVVLSDRPALAWPAEKTEGYTVELFHADKVLWQTTIRTAHLAYPEREAALKRGSKYQWRVTARMGEDKTQRIIESRFTVAGRDDLEELADLKHLTNSDAPADWLLAAATYEAHGVYDEALVLYEKLAARFPNEANFQNALGNYYERAGRDKKAEEARDKAKKLIAAAVEK